MRKFTFIICLGIIVASANGGQAQELLECHAPDPRGRWEEPVVDMKRMALDLNISPSAGTLEGNVSYDFAPRRQRTDSIFLHAVDIDIQEVKIDGTLCRYKSTPQGLTIYPAKVNYQIKSQHTLFIQYKCKPKKGIYFIGFNDSTGRSRRQMWTQGQGIDNRHWIPGWDSPTDKLTTDITVRIDENWELLSNGKRRDNGKKVKQNGKDWYQFSYTMKNPHSFYLIMLGAGKYKVHSHKSKGGVAIHDWYYPDMPERREPTYRYTARIMDFLEKETGVKYPWDEYSQIPVQEFLYGAMENTTATVFGDFFYVDNRTFPDRNYVGVNAHEMTHQWFGDYVSAKSYRDQWLQESFATYYAKLAERDIWGKDYYDWNRRAEQNAAINADNANLLPLTNTAAGTARIYQKGSFVLDMLRYVAGDEDYRRVITHYLQKNAYGNVTTFDLYNAFHDVLGMNLDWFFDQWVHRGGMPSYEVAYEPLATPTGNVLRWNIRQTQAQTELTGLFTMPIWLQIQYTDGTRDSMLRRVGAEQEIIDMPIRADKTVAFAVFDPDNRILRRLKYVNRPAAHLRETMMNAEYALDRYDALVESRMENNSVERMNDLQAMFTNNPQWFIRSEIISQLGASAFATVPSAFADKESKVRLAAVNSIVSAEQPAIIAQLEKMLRDSSYFVEEAALNKLCALVPHRRLEFLNVVKDDFGYLGNVRFAYLRWAYTAAGPDIAARVVDYAGPAFEFRTRLNAFSTLQEMNYLDATGAAYLIEAAVSANGRLARPAREALSYFAKQGDKRALIATAIRASKLKTSEKEALARETGATL